MVSPFLKITSQEPYDRGKTSLHKLSHIFDITDTHITSKEITNAIKTLKNNKAAGLDLIVIKHSQYLLLPELTQLLILTTATSI